jgi:hypothetical protein
MKRSSLLFGLLGFVLATVGTASAQQRNLPDGPNRDFVSRTCQGCHDLAMVLAAAGLTREGWDATIEEMVSYGMRVSPEERARLLDYLATYLSAPR